MLYFLVFIGIVSVSCRGRHISKDPAPGEEFLQETAKTEPTNPLNLTLIETKNYSNSLLMQEFGDKEAINLVIADPQVEKTISEDIFAGEDFYFAKTESELEYGKDNEEKNLVVVLNRPENTDESLALASSDGGMDSTAIAAMVGGPIAIVMMMKGGHYFFSNRKIASPTTAPLPEFLPAGPVTTPPRPVSAPLPAPVRRAVSAPPPAPVRAVSAPPPAPVRPAPVRAVSAPRPAKGIHLQRVHAQLPGTYAGNPTKWPYPSDHLPIGATLKTPKGTELTMVSYNTLNRNFIDNFTGKKGTGGLQTIKNAKVGKDDPGSLDRRDAANSLLIHYMLEQKPGTIVSLQELSPEMLRRLQERLKGTSFKILSTDQGFSRGGRPSEPDSGAILYDSNLLTPNASKDVHYGGSKKYIQDVRFTTRASETFRVINTHREFYDQTTLAQYCAQPSSEPTFLMGDFNQEVGGGATPVAGFGRVTDAKYLTHWNTKNQVTAYDGIFARNAQGFTQQAPPTYNAAAHAVFQ